MFGIGPKPTSNGNNCDVRYHFLALNEPAEVFQGFCDPPELTLPAKGPVGGKIRQ